MTGLPEKWKRLGFAAGFLLLIVLSMDIWNWNSATPLVMGMPFWVIWDIVLVISIGVYYILFCIYIWRD